MSHALAGPRILGLNGSTQPTRPLPTIAGSSRAVADGNANHDSAAVLMCNGAVVAAIEEERLNRVKHTNRIASSAVRACLDIAGVAIEDIDRFAFVGREDLLDQVIFRHTLNHPGAPGRESWRAYLADVLSEDLRSTIDPASLVFVEHHVAHAVSAYAIGPFPDALIVTLDGVGDGLSGTVWAGHGGQMDRLRNISASDSLGMLYLFTTRCLGYGTFDEYKVMGLAPYGNPQRFQSVFEPIWSLEADGRFKSDHAKWFRALRALPPPRRSTEPLTEIHADIAAALQHAIERAAFHLLRHFREETGLRHLCLAGGVAHNSTMIGNIASSGLFEGVFVQPAAYDAGCALGAALAVHRELAPRTPIAPLASVYWGRDIGDSHAVWTRLERWAHVLRVTHVADVAASAASMIEDGKILGWVQGRSEFGPRALGNRSIIADPRPAANKARVNELIKHRESYRPFAPAVLDEYARDIFEIPAGTSPAFMTLTVPVRMHMRGVLGAVTHVDGTARVQTVSRSTNPPFWALIEAFRARTGIPVVLNTSFNHRVEPIVDSVDDAVTCFLTTGLDALAVGDYIVEKRGSIGDWMWTLVPVIPDYVRLSKSRQLTEGGGLEDTCLCEHTSVPSASRLMSASAYELLQHLDGERSLGHLLDQYGLRAKRVELAQEIEQLWAHRSIRLVPSTAVDVGGSADYVGSGVSASAVRG